MIVCDLVGMKGTGFDKLNGQLIGKGVYVKIIKNETFDAEDAAVS